MVVEFTGEIWFWKGPAPWFFVTVPEGDSAEIKALERGLSYGWGMIPVNVTIGATRYYTALWPKDGAYIVPIKTIVRKAESLQEGDVVKLRLDVIDPRMQ